MVPMPVHKVCSYISLSLVEGGVAVFGGSDGALYGRDIKNLISVSGEFELADSGRDVAELVLGAQFLPAKGRSPELAVLEEVNLLSVRRPSGVAGALCVTGQLNFVASVCIAYKEIAAAAVLLDGSVAHSVEYLISVGGELRV